MDYSAFYQCTALTEVTIPNSVTLIGASAFKDCTGLTTVNIDSANSALTSIGNSAFSRCAALTEVTIPNSVTAIGIDAFSGCTSLATVNMDSANSDLAILETFAFSSCTALTGFCIPKNLTDIGELAFTGCTSIEAFTIDPGNTAFTVTDGVIFSGINSENLVVYPVGKTDTQYTAPDSVTDISNSAFLGNTSLESLTLGKNVANIGASAFEGCTALKNVQLIYGKDRYKTFYTDPFPAGFDPSGITIKAPWASVSKKFNTWGSSADPQASGTAATFADVESPTTTLTQLPSDADIYYDCDGEVKVDGSQIFAEGNAITIKAGTDPAKTNIYFNEDTSFEYPITIGNTEPTAEGYDLKDYTIYGGNRLGDLLGDTNVTMDGGKVKAIYGGGKTNTHGSLNVNISGAPQIGDASGNGIVIDGTSAARAATSGMGSFNIVGALTDGAEVYVKLPDGYTPAGPIAKAGAGYTITKSDAAKINLVGSSGKIPGLGVSPTGNTLQVVYTPMGGLVKPDATQEDIDKMFGTGNAVLSGNTITLLNDITIPNEIAFSGGSFILDATGKTITNEGSDSSDGVISVNAGASLVIEGGSFISDGDDPTLAIGNGSNLTLKTTSFENKKSGGLTFFSIGGKPLQDCIATGYASNLDDQSITTATGKINILPKSADKTFVPIGGIFLTKNLVYSGKPQSGFTGTPTSGPYTGPLEYRYSGTGTTVYPAGATAPTNAGTYMLIISIPESDKLYTGVSEVIEFTIAKAPLTVKADDKEVKQDSMPIPTATISYSGFVNGEDVSVLKGNTLAAVHTVTDSKKPGKYAINITGSATPDNYILNLVSGTLTVIPTSVPTGDSNTWMLLIIPFLMAGGGILWYLKKRTGTVK